MAYRPEKVGGVTRYKVASGAINRMGSVLTVFLGLVAVWMGGLFLAITLHAKAFVPYWPLGLLALVATLLVYVNLPGRVDVGADGLLVDLRNERRFIAFDDVEDATVYRESAMGKHFVGVLLSLVAGGTQKLPIGEDHFGAGDQAEQLAAGIRGALRAFRERDFAEDAEALARGNRSAADWAARLRSVGEGANAGPREAPVDPDRLWRIAESPGAPAELRAGAAAALRVRLDDDGKQRLRIAAEATVSPELRGALTTAAEGDEEAVVAALERI